MYRQQNNFDAVNTLTLFGKESVKMMFHQFSKVDIGEFDGNDFSVVSIKIGQFNKTSI